MGSAIGLMAGPLSPAVMLEIRGLRFSASMAMATKVFTREMASAPAFSADLAMAGMLVTFGESFTINGRREAPLQLATRSSRIARALPKPKPPRRGVGQETVHS